MDLFEEQSDGIIRFVEASAAERKILHQFAREKKIYSGGLLCEEFPYKSFQYKECYYCDYKKVLLDEYCFGKLPNNEDQYWRGKCPNCTWSITHDCVNNDILHYIKCRNIFAVGQCFKSYRHPDTNEQIPKEDVVKLLKDKLIYEVNIPKNLRKPRKIGKCIGSIKTEWKPL